ncbi:MAG: redoxin domain-containing protein [Planctomycetaceae bacterium]|nr:redoxin domain-containing protein [Planctomycetaceae bacterium]
MRSLTALPWLIASLAAFVLRASAGTAADAGPAANRSTPMEVVAKTIDRSALFANLKTPDQDDSKPVLLVLHRGIGCVRCVSTLSVIGRRSGKFRDLGVQLLAVSPSLPAPETLPQLKRDLGIDFPLLVDPELAVFQQFGCVKPDAQVLHGLILIDAQGNIRWSQVSEHAETDLEVILQRCRESIDPGRGNP